MCSSSDLDTSNSACSHFVLTGSLNGTTLVWGMGRAVCVQLSHAGAVCLVGDTSRNVPLFCPASRLRCLVHGMGTKKPSTRAGLCVWLLPVFQTVPVWFWFSLKRPSLRRDSRDTPIGVCPVPSR